MQPGAVGVLVFSSYMRRFAACLLPLLFACDQSVYTGSYAFPTAIIGIQAQAQENAEQMKRDLALFAAAHHLDVYESSTPGSLMAAGQRERVEYAPDPPNLQYGFSMLFEELSTTCALVMFSERSPSWTATSLKALADLQSTLERAFPGNVHLLVRPKREQNWPERQRLRFVDPEWPQSFDELCDRMTTFSNGG